MVVIAITGGAAGIGQECARQLSAEPEVSKIVITARSVAKAEAAIAELVKSTGKDKSFFDYLVLDLGDVSSIKAAIVKFPAFDRLCLNAGGSGTGEMHKSGNGMPDAMVINTVGHAMLVDGLFEAGKVKEGSRIVWVGSEVSRALWSFVPMLPNYYCCGFKETDIDWALSKDYDGVCSCIPIRRQLGDYKNSKIVGHMHFANLAKEKAADKVHITSVSPGAVGGSFVEKAHFPVKQLMSCMPCLFRVLCVTHACSPATTLEIGAARYVEVLTGEEPKWPTGSMPMSGYPFPCCCCMWGANGKMIDNRPLVPYFTDEALCEKAATKVRERVKQWEIEVPGQQTMH